MVTNLTTDGFGGRKRSRLDQRARSDDTNNSENANDLGRLTMRLGDTDVDDDVLLNKVVISLFCAVIGRCNIDL